MEFSETKEHNELFSQAVKAGKRTYFFDVKETKTGEKFLVITESKKKFDNEDGKFFYEKHKIFLYPEDFEKFKGTFENALRFVETGERPVIEETSTEEEA